VNVATFTYPAHYLTVLFPLAYQRGSDIHRNFTVLFFIGHKKWQSTPKKDKRKAKERQKKGKKRLRSKSGKREKSGTKPDLNPCQRHLIVATCNRKRSDLHSAAFSTGINCD
jgi:uncharacterized membrane protein